MPIFNWPTLAKTLRLRSMAQAAPPQVDIPKEQSQAGASMPSLSEWLAQAKAVGSNMVPQPQPPDTALFHSATHPRLAAALEGALIGASSAQDGDYLSGVRGLLGHEMEKRQLEQQYAAQQAALPGQQLQAGLAVLSPYEKMKADAAAEQRLAGTAQSEAALRNAQIGEANARADALRNPPTPPAAINQVVVQDSNSPTGWSQVSRDERTNQVLGKVLGVAGPAPQAPTTRVMGDRTFQWDAKANDGKGDWRDIGPKPATTAAGDIGNLNDVVQTALDNPDYYQSLPASAKMKIGPALAAAGFKDFKKLSPASQRILETAQTAEPLVDLLIQTLEPNKNDNNLILGSDSALAQHLKFMTYRAGISTSGYQDTLNQLEAYLGLAGIQGMLQGIRRGDLIKEFQSHLPRPTDTPKLAYDKLMGLKTVVLPAAQRAVLESTPAVPPAAPTKLPPTATKGGSNRPPLSSFER